MKARIFIFSFVLLIIASRESIAQHNNKDIVKLNLTGLALKNYSVQYERVVNHFISFAFSVRTMPSTDLPFKSLVLDAVGDDPDATKAINNLQVSNFAFTPEMRLYLSRKGKGRGFYIAPFYRFATFHVNNIIFDYQNSSMVTSSMALSGKLTSNTGGILFGSQWPIGKHLCLDLWFFGPHYGSGNGTFTGVASQPLTTEEQDDLRQQLEDLDIPLTHKTVTVNASGATLQLKGPWGGIRSGISFGIRF